MSPVKARSRRYIYTGSILTASGILFSTLAWEQVGFVSLIFVAIGAVFTITGINILKGR